MTCWSHRVAVRHGVIAVVIFASSVFGRTAVAAGTQVIDGDTLSIGAVHYRLFGIDAPEAGQQCESATGPKWRCGDIATARLVELVRGAEVKCNSQGVDDYDRILAVCTSSGRELNAAMVEEGLAWAFRKYSDRYSVLEDMIRSHRRGIWQAATEAPWDFRARRWEFAKQAAPKGCPIKGNVSDNGRIYHAPWSPWYDRTKVSVERGEPWFCSEREAIDAGWRAPIWGK